MDEATSEIYYAQLVEEESTRTLMTGVREVIERKGLFGGPYSESGYPFFLHAPGGRSGRQGPAQQYRGALQNQDFLGIHQDAARWMRRAFDRVAMRQDKCSRRCRHLGPGFPHPVTFAHN